MCQAKFGMSSGAPAPPASTAVAPAAGTGATHTVIVAPTKGVLRYVPFAVNASVGDTVRFMVSLLYLSFDLRLELTGFSYSGVLDRTPSPSHPRSPSATSRLMWTASPPVSRMLLSSSTRSSTTPSPRSSSALFTAIARRACSVSSTPRVLLLALPPPSE